MTRPNRFSSEGTRGNLSQNSTGSKMSRFGIPLPKITIAHEIKKMSWSRLTSYFAPAATAKSA